MVNIHVYFKIYIKYICIYIYTQYSVFYIYIFYLFFLLIFSYLFFSYWERCPWVSKCNFCLSSSSFSSICFVLCIWKLSYWMHTYSESICLLKKLTVDLYILKWYFSLSIVIDFGSGVCFVFSFLKKNKSCLLVISFFIFLFLTIIMFIVGFL